MLYGMGNGADKILNVLNSYNITPAGVFASDGFVRDKFFRGYHIESLSYFEKKYEDFIILLCFGTEREEVIENIKNIMSRHELLAPDVPVFGNNIFDSDFVNKNYDRLKKVYDRLADDLSEKTFENMVKFKLSGDLNYLFSCEAEKKAPYDEILNLSDNEVYLDLGAYRGDTVKEFLETKENYKKITAIEPDPKSFKKLKTFSESIKNIETINACVLDFTGETEFDISNSRGSSAGKGENKVKCVSVDDICPEATFIKADIEGAELKMINGAVNTIKANRPKMALSCYHRSEDLFTIPERIFEIREDYKIYMRHFKSVPAWDTVYYFVNT